MLKHQGACSGLILLFSLILISGSTAYVYEQTNQRLSQTVLDVVTFNLNNQALGGIRESETRTFTEEDVSSIGDAITVCVTGHVSGLTLP
jgi:hypothetical protein